MRDEKELRLGKNPHEEGLKSAHASLSNIRPKGKDVRWMRAGVTAAAPSGDPSSWRPAGARRRARAASRAAAAAAVVGRWRRASRHSALRRALARVTCRQLARATTPHS